MIFQILKIMFIIDILSLIGLAIMLRKEIIETIKENKDLKNKQKKILHKITMNEFGGWAFDEKENIDSR